MFRMYGTHIIQNYVLIATIGIAAWKTLKKYFHDMKIPEKFSGRMKKY